MSPLKALDPPALYDEQVEKLALVTEVLAKREEEIKELNTLLQTTRAKIASEKSAWSAQKDAEEAELRRRRESLEMDYRQKMQEAEAYIRQTKLSLDQQVKEEEQARQKVLALMAKEQALGDLNRERMEVETLRREVEGRHDAVEQRWSAAQAALTQAANDIEQAKKLIAEVEQRNLALNEREDNVRRAAEHVALQEKQLAIVRQQLDERMTKETPHASVTG